MRWNDAIKSPRWTALLLIRVYQKTFSFDHGILRHLFPYGFCQYHPTCSEYAYRSIERYGLFKGGWLAVYRVLRCNPFVFGGNDPVPDTKDHEK